MCACVCVCVRVWGCAHARILVSPEEWTVTDFSCSFATQQPFTFILTAICDFPLGGHPFPIPLITYPHVELGHPIPHLHMTQAKPKKHSETSGISGKDIPAVSSWN